MAGIISEVVPCSIASELGIEAGDVLVAIDEHLIEDVLDYQFYSQEEELEVKIVKASGETWIIEVEKELDEDLGLIFFEPVFDRMKICQNRCVFCFIDQLPPNMRETLYVKDDDYRYSFMFGNYVSLTNMKESDWEKLVRLRLSPLYISVHCLRPELRAKIMNNPRAAQIRNQLERLKQAGIEMHTQVVLCPGINDGEVLDETIRGLAEFYPLLRSVGIVPVGLTGFRQGLEKLEAVSEDQARQLIARINDYQTEFRRDMGLGFVYLADEFFIKSGQLIPAAEYYDDYCQIENGIGMARRLLDEFSLSVSDLPDEVAPRKFTVLTGEAARPVLGAITARLNQVGGLEVDLLTVPNCYFSGNVSVSGLITGRDIIQVLKQEHRDTEIVISSVMLKHGSDVFLDSLNISDIEEQTGARLHVVEDVNELVGLMCGRLTRARD